MTLEKVPSLRIRLALVTLIVLVFEWVARHYVLDDGLIYARFIRNALTGNGLVFNPGDAVNSLTSPLFSYLLLVSSWLFHGNVILAEHILFIASFLGACALAEFIVPWSGVFAATTAYFYTLIGLETTLFLLMILLVVQAYRASRLDWLPTLLVLTLLTRFEGGLLIPILAYALWKQRRFPRLISLLPALAILLAYLLLNHHWYGAYLPHSAASKFGQGRSGYWGRWPRGFLNVTGWAFPGRTAYFTRTLYVVPLVMYFSFRGWRALRGLPINQLVPPFCLGLLLFYTLFNIPSYHWYWAPLIFFPMLYAVYGVPHTPAAARTFLAVTLLAGITNFFFLRTFLADPDYIHAAQWLNANSAPNATVETVEIGHIGWYTRRRVNDILGLTLPKNADHIAHRDLTSWIVEDKPDFIVVHQPLWRFEQVVQSHPEYREAPFHSGGIHILQRSAPVSP